MRQPQVIFSGAKDLIVVPAGDMEPRVPMFRLAAQGFEFGKRLDFLVELFSRNDKRSDCIADRLLEDAFRCVKPLGVVFFGRRMEVGRDGDFHGHVP